MENNDIIQGAKLICRFVSDEPCAYSDSGDFIPSEFCNDINGEATYYDWDNMRFHKDWNWLIPVVRKLRNLNLIINNSALSQVNESGKVVRTLIKLMDIEQVWQATVDYIKWYNSQNNKP